MEIDVMWAGVTGGCRRILLLDQPVVEINLEVTHPDHGWTYGVKQLISEQSIEDSMIDVWKFVLNDMVEALDNMITEHYERREVPDDEPS